MPVGTDEDQIKQMVEGQNPDTIVNNELRTEIVTGRAVVQTIGVVDPTIVQTRWSFYSRPGERVEVRQGEIFLQKLEVVRGTVYEPQSATELYISGAGIIVAYLGNQAKRNFAAKAIVGKVVGAGVVGLILGKDEIVVPAQRALGIHDYTIVYFVSEQKIGELGGKITVDIPPLWLLDP